MAEKNLEEFTKTRKWAHTKLNEKGSKTYRAFIEMEAATFNDAALTASDQASHVLITELFTMHIPANVRTDRV